MSRACHDLLVSFTAWLVVAGTLECRGQGSLQPIQITFDAVPRAPGQSIFTQQYSESGVLFRPLGVPSPGNGFSHRRGGGTALPPPDNGTAYLAAAMGDSLQFSFINGSLFNLEFVDLAEYSTVVPDIVTVPFIGYRPDGSTVSTSHTTDGIIDGIGPLADFQTFSFKGFTGLTRIEIPTYGWSIDNVRVSVPEPATWSLILVGGLMLLARRRWLEKAQPRC